ncbi:gas vesicle protein GVPa [Parafrankia sp. EUN1f]|nr:gas vesicle protein GVPa [Parafrankia sp. EUN1f]
MTVHCTNQVKSVTDQRFVPTPRYRGGDAGARRQPRGRVGGPPGTGEPGLEGLPRLEGLPQHYQGPARRSARGTASAPSRRPGRTARTSAQPLADLLDRLVDTGAVVSGDVVVALAGVDLLRVDLRLLLVGVQTALEGAGEVRP